MPRIDRISIKTNIVDIPARPPASVAGAAQGLSFAARRQDSDRGDDDPTLLKTPRAQRALFEVLRLKLPLTRGQVAHGA